MSAPNGRPSAADRPASVSLRPPVRRRRDRSRWYATGALVAAAILLPTGLFTDWFGLETSKPSGSACSTGVLLQGDGAQIAVPLMGVWTAAFAASTGDLVNYPGSGSGTGLNHFTTKSVDFAVTDDPLAPSERAALATPALTFPFVGGALTIIYNLPGVPGQLQLSGPALVGIYNGSISRWDDPTLVALNPGLSLPTDTIVPVLRSDSAGTTYVLSDFLTQSESWWATNVGKGISIAFPPVPGELGEHGNSLVISTVVTTRYSIGYSDLTDVLTGTSPPQYAAIQNPSGHFVAPSIATTESALLDKVATLGGIPNSAADWYNVSMVNANGPDDYPIATFLYMFVYQATDQGLSPSLAKAQVLVEWLHWIFTSGQPYANATTPSALYYAPLPPPIVTVDEAGLPTMTYNGAPIPSCR